jgi:sugar-phosphatase
MTDFSISGLLFDCDGVLVDSLESAAVAWDIWSAEYAPTYNFRRDVVHGRRAGDTVLELVGAETAAEATRALELLELAHVDGIVAIAGASGLVATLTSGTWAIATSGVRELALARLSAAGFPIPAELVTADDVANGKPFPDPYLLAAKLIGLDPAVCVVFEDAPAGIAAATAAGVGVIVGVGAGALESGATAVVPDLTAISYRDGVLSVDDALRLG